MRDRLIELFKKIDYKIFPNSTVTANLANQFSEYALNDIVDKLLANGVIVPPCKVGDKVYVICNYTVQETTVFSMSAETEEKKWVFFIKAKAVDGRNRTVDGYYETVFKTFIFGRTVFFTKEEAEQALKGGTE